MTNVPHEHRLAVVGGDLCWFEWGTALPDRPSLLLVHATGFHARCWDGVVAALPAGSHIIAPDLRGHGRSHRPQSLSNWAATADDLLPLIDAIPGGRLLGAGHSMGGVCLVRAAAARPDRFAALTLIDPVIFAPEFYAQYGAEPAGDHSAHFVAKRRNRWASAAQMLDHFSAREPYSRWDPAVLAAYCEWGVLPAPDGDDYELACPPHLEASAYMGSAAFDPLAAAATIASPVTVVRARQSERGAALDFSNSPTWPDLASAFPDGHDVAWSDCSHFIPMEVPGRVAGLITATVAG